MSGKRVSAIMLSLLVMSTLALAFHIQPVETRLLPLTAPDESAATEGTINLATQEPPPTEWNKTYGGPSDDTASALVRTNDGGYAIPGWTRSAGAGGNDFLLVKTDANGKELWNKTYGGTADDYANALVQTSDGRYALAGYTNSYGAGGADFWLVKTDASGNKQWSQYYGGAHTDIANALVQTADGGYALAGLTAQYPNGDFMLVKTDPAGNVQWTQTYGGTGYEQAYALVQTADGGYAVAGYTNSYGAGADDMWLVKTDSVGHMQWNKTYGGTWYDEAYALVQTTDGGYVLAGDTCASVNSVTDFYLVKTDGNGIMQWDRTYGGPIDNRAYSLVQTADGGYALAGRTFTPAISWDFWMVKTDSTGNQQWNKTCGGADTDIATALVQTVDGGYALAGYTKSYGAGASDFWLVKIGGGGPQPLPPKITGIDPSQPIAGGGKQLLSVLGEGFVLSSEVTLTIGSDARHIPSDRTLFISPNRIEIIAGLIEGLWKASVTNPGGIQSNEYAFQVRGVSIEDGKRVLELALQYTKPPYEWTIEDATKMAAIAGPESGWLANAAFDEGDYSVNYIGQESWGLWQIFMMWHLDILAELGAPIDPPYYQTVKWLLDPKNNVKAAYKVWHEAKGFYPGATGFEPWKGYTSGKWKLEPWYGVFRVKASVYKCPVNVTMTDNYGRIISETENQIPGASFVYLNATDTKIFYLPLNLTYEVQLNATDYGNCTIGQITPTESIYETAFSQATFNLTSETVAEFDLPQYDANYTLKVDENGDGLIDYELAPEVVTITTEYDIGITESVPSKTIIGEDHNFRINTTVMNYGAYPETFNVTIYADATFINQTEVTISSGNSTAINFTWNTAGFAKGNYTISAYAWPVPGETETADNNCTCGFPVHVGVPGDVSGTTPGVYDGVDNMKDIAYLVSLFNTNPNSPNWQPNADVNDDLVCNMKDIAIAVYYFNQHE